MSKVQTKKPLTPEMIENGYAELPKFRAKLEKVLDKFAKYVACDDEDIAEDLKNTVLGHFPDDLTMLEHDKLLATYEYLFGCFNSPEELISLHDYELNNGGPRAADAFIRVMVKGKKIWVENWVYNDDYEDTNTNTGFVSNGQTTEYYGYNMSVGIEEEQRDKIYGENIVNLYDVEKGIYFYDENISW